MISQVINEIEGKRRKGESGLYPLSFREERSKGGLDKIYKEKVLDVRFALLHISTLLS